MTDRSPLPIRLTLANFPLVTGLAALWLGQDASWDLRNYHFYNPFSYLTGRMGFDVAVAQVANYYNPLLHIPFYYAAVSLPPKVVAFILGTIPGLNIFPLYAIAKRAVRFENSPWHRWFCLAASMLGVLGAATISEIGTSFGDNIVSLPVLLAIWWILAGNRSFEKPGMAGAAFVSIATGVITGAAVGLKQPFAIYALGICGAFFGLRPRFSRRFALAFLFGLGVLAGIALTGGFWMAEMWHRFGNPLFPYFNEYFKSPWAALAPYRDIRFIPKGIFEWLTFVFAFTLDPMKVGEVAFRDLRFSLMYALFLAWPVFSILGAIRKKRSQPCAERNFEARFVLIFFAVSFVLWVKLFSIYRYIAVCEMLAPIGIFLLSTKVARSFGLQMAVSIGAFALTAATLVPGDWSRRPFGTDYFGVQPPPLSNPAATMILVTGHEPMAYMVPFFPAQVRFLRVQSYLTGPSDAPNAMNRLMTDTISRHPGDLFWLYRSFEEWSAFEAMKAMGVEIEKDRCVELLPHVEPLREHPYYFCPVKKRNDL